MYSKILFNTLLIIASVVMQLSFIDGLPQVFSNLNFILVILIFLLVMRSFSLALWWAVGIGWLLDIYSFLPFGIYLVGLFLTVLLINFLFTNFFTNASLYSFLAITFFSSIFYEFLIHVIVYAYSFFSRERKFFILNKEFWINTALELILNLGLVFILFYSISFLSQRLKPVFLVKGK